MSTNITAPIVAADDDILAAEWNEMRDDIIVNAGDYETAGGDGDTITLAIDSSIVAYAAGQKFRFQANAANSGAVTLNVNAIGSVAVKKNHDQALITNDIESGQEVEVIYDGATFQMLTPSAHQEHIIGTINAGETINGGTLPVACFIQAGDVESTSITQITNDSSVAVYDSNLQIGQNFEATDENISKIELILEEVVAPSGNLNLDIYAMDGSGFPTGASLGTSTINANTVSGKSTVEFAFATNVDTVIGSDYVMVLSFPSGDATNHILWYFNTTSVYAGGFGVRSADAGATWITWGGGAYDCAFTLYSEKEDNKLYACDGNDTDKLKFIGFAISNSTDGNPISFQGSGIVRGFTGLAEGEEYYIQDDKTIGTAQGTYRVKVGTAISETELLIEKKPTLGTLQTAFSKDTDYTSGKDAFITIVFNGNSGSGTSQHSNSITVDGVLVAEQNRIIGSATIGFKSHLSAMIPSGKVWRYTWSLDVSSALVSYYQLG